MEILGKHCARLKIYWLNSAINKQKQQKSNFAMFKIKKSISLQVKFFEL